MDLKDGTGSGYRAKVDNKNRLHTSATNTDARSAAIIRGEHFIANPGFMTLTTDGESAILYIKNNSDRDILLKLFRLVAGPSTGGAGAGKIRIQVNPTGGTLITDETATAIINTNVGSTKSFDGIGYEGGEGKTVTGQAGTSELLTPGAGNHYEADLLATLPKGGSIGVSYEPPTGNTSMEISLIVGLHLVDADATV